MSSTFSGFDFRAVRIRNSTRGVSTILAAVIVVIVVAVAAGATYFEATSNMHTTTTTLTIGSTITSTQSGTILSTTATVISTSISTSATTIASTSILTQTQTVTAPSQNVRDIAGDYVSIPTNISRISVGWYALNTMIFAMGGENKIVTGMQYNGHPWASLIFPSATNVTSAYNSTSGALNVESLLAADPQVFLTNIGDTNVQLTEAVGIPTLQFEMENYSEEESVATLLGQVIGGSTTQKAQLFNSFLSNSINSINSTISSNSSITRPSVVKRTPSKLDSFRDFLRETLETEAGGIVAHAR